MFYRILADVVVAIHLGYVSYVVVGELLILAGLVFRWQWIRNMWFRATHLLMILVVAAEALADFTCPLTTWESQLLAASGEPEIERSFVGRLMHNAFFFDFPDEDVILPWFYYGFAALVVLTLVIAPPRWRRSKGKPIIQPESS